MAITIYNWSELEDGDVFGGGGANPPSFDVAAGDVLHIDDVSLSAADFFVDCLSFSEVQISYGGKTVTLDISPKELYSGNFTFTFADGSIFRMGDDDSVTGGDDSPNTLSGGAG